MATSDIIPLMEDIIRAHIRELFSTDSAVVLTRPDVQFGDYATNVALQLAKPLGKNPREIAEQLAEALRQTGMFSEVSVAGPGFINLRIAADALFSQLEQAWTDEYGTNDEGAGKTVIVEYPSPNMAKPYSVGHLRPGNQGWAIKRLMEATGWKVITDNHLGDYGSPFGIWVVGFEEFSSEEALARDGVYELGRVYIQTKKALKDEATSGGQELANRVQDWLLRLERGDEAAVAYSDRFKEISLAHIHSVMGRLGISTDYELGEAFYVERGKQAVANLVGEGLAVQNPDGSVIVTLDEYGFDVPLLVQKSNGAALYATTDLATILYREETFQPDRVVYAVGAEQQFYFSQLFAMAKKLGIDTELVHVWFGTIDQLGDDGTREKMSSRKGVVLMEELLDHAEAKAREITEGRDISDEDIKKIAVGAIKFSDFIADRRTNILFDWNTIFALGGFSGPYVQYAAVRVNKLLADAGAPGAHVGYDFAPEKEVLLQLLAYPDVVARAARELEPHKIASYLYELARVMNRYYEQVRILDAPELERNARLAVLGRVAHVFTHGLNVLGIEVPSRM